MAGADWVQAVKPECEYAWSDAPSDAWKFGRPERADGKHVVAIDCGAKSNILRHLADVGATLTLIPEHAANGIGNHRADVLGVKVTAWAVGCTWPGRLPGRFGQLIFR